MQVTVLAEDRLTAQGVEAHLAADDRVHVLPVGAEESPDVLLVITAELEEKTFTALKRYCPEDPAAAPRLVLVADKPTAQQLVRVIRLGLVAFMSREKTTLADITEMLCAVARGAASLPQSMLGSLLEQIRTRQWNGQGPDTEDESSSFTARELAILRQLAAGLSTTEIAAALHYSERTVKYVIHEMIARHGLRNRVHAVAYALRQGLL
ncbi:response regulator transcription factor [Streptomyces adustus]|uniref:Response regulator transcription factor n=1 Tax=Streptomyces adustus TaxID=1609272 RepID=A0A5N8V8B6_9ACTN|nr:response regulator transcription factor [Streptomyces adustus]MPY30225.1 response regulator transcription factor [Streptomyces adustus]